MRSVRSSVPPVPSPAVDYFDRQNLAGEGTGGTVSSEQTAISNSAQPRKFIWNPCRIPKKTFIVAKDLRRD
jgi:hypothetical protein